MADRDVPGFSIVDVCLIITALIWGLNSAVVKYALGEFHPLAFNAVRFSLASVATLALCFFRDGSLYIQKQHVLRIVLTGVLGNTVYQSLFIYGISLSSAGNTTLVLALIPVSIAILARFFAGEQIQAIGWAGILVSLVGILLVTLSSEKQISLSSATLRGDALTLAGVFCWAGYTILSKPLLKFYSPLKVTSLTMASGTLVLLLMSLPQVASQNWTSVSLPAWGGLMYSTSLSLVFGYVIWNWGVSKLGGTRTAVYQNLITITGLLASWLMLGETWNWLKFGGAVLTLSGLFAVRSSGLRAKPATSLESR